MAQHDYNLINQSGANFRTDLNNALSAIVSNNSGASEPATMFAYELWVDTSNSVMKIRNSGNDGWITLPFSIAADNTVDINGGTVNGITSLSFSSGSTVASILDEDNLSSDSATALATQQSIKAYVDSQVTAQDLDFQADSGGALSIDLDSETFTLTGGTGIDTAGSGNAVTFSVDSTIATLSGSQTLTNKTIDVDSNTVSNIEVDNLKSGVLDTDLSSVSGSDDTLASAKAIKTYVDTAITAEDLDISDGSNSGSIDLDSETLGLLGGTGVTSALSGNNITFSIGQAVGTSDNVQFGTVTANLTGQVSTLSNHDTDNLSEGSSNLYFTNARARAAISENSAQLSYNSSTGVLTYTQGNSDTVSEGSTNLFYTDTRVATKIDSYVDKAFIDALNVVAASASGNAATATALATTRTFSITGDATASAQNFDGTGNVTLTLSIDDDAVALGTKTTGNYVAAISGTTNEIEVSGSGSETATVTIGLPNDVTIAGNLTVNGTTTTVNTETLSVEDPLIKLANANSSSDSVDIGFYGLYDTSGSQDLYAGLFRDANDSGKFKLFKDLQVEPTTTVNVSGTGYAGGTLVATIEGNVTGNVTGQVSTLSNHDTDNLSEGSSNLYHTTARARAAISEGSTQLSYNSTTGVLTYTQGDTDTVSEGSSNLYYTDARANSAIDARVTNTFINNLSGVVADTSTALATGRTIGMTGDVVWTSASFDGSGNVTGTATIQADAVEQSMIADDAVGADQLAASSVVTASIVDDSITQAKIADDAVGADQLAASAVVTASIVDDNITQAKIADDAVGADQLAASSVVTASVVDDAITQAKMAANSIGITELNVSDGSNGQALKTDGSGNLSFGSVSVSQTLTVVGRAANVAITITSGVLGVIARSGTINVGV